MSVYLDLAARCEAATGGGSGELHELRRLRKRQAFPIPASACAVSTCLGITLDAVGCVSFTLKRKRGGVQVMFAMPAGPSSLFTWNVSAMLGVSLSTFKEARDWAHAYAAGFGQTISENVAVRETQPTGADRKLLNAKGCKEDWLSSDVPKLFAEAAVRCQHPAGFCMGDGYCHYGTCDMQIKPSASLRARDAASTGEAL